VDWLRNHGFESVVNRVEQWYYSSKPTGKAPRRADLPFARRTRVRTDAPATATTTTLPGGSSWQDVTWLAVPPSAVQQTFVIPDPTYPSVAVAVVRVDQRQVRTVYVPGLQEPGGRFAWGGGIPLSQRPGLLAAFNAGFKMKHITGGVWTEGRNAGHPLEDGQASAVIYRDGRTAVVDWGRDARMTPDVISVRQNLALIVDGGKKPPDHLNVRRHMGGS
jgi:hypothetical protein